MHGMPGTSMTPILVTKGLAIYDSGFPNEAQVIIPPFTKAKLKGNYACHKFR